MADQQIVIDKEDLIESLEQDEERRGAAPPSPEGEFDYSEGAGQDILTLLLTMDTDGLANLLAKANIDEEKASLYKEILIREMIERKGSVDYVALMKFDLALSVAINGWRARQIENIMSNPRSTGRNRGGLFGRLGSMFENRRV